MPKQAQFFSTQKHGTSELERIYEQIIQINAELKKRIRNHSTQSIRVAYVDATQFPESLEDKRALNKKLSILGAQINLLITKCKASDGANPMNDTADLLKGEIDINQYAAKYNKAPGRPWSTAGYAMIGLGVVCSIAALITAASYTGPIAIGVAIGCIAVGMLLLVSGMYCFNRTGISSTMHEIAAVFKKEDTDLKNILKEITEVKSSISEESNGCS